MQIGIDLALLAGLGLLIAFVLGAWTRTAPRWRVYPGPDGVTVAQAVNCLEAEGSPSVRRVHPSTIVLAFASGATLRLAFLNNEAAAMRLAPFSFRPALARSSENNVVITRIDGSSQPPPASLRLLGGCLLPS